MKKAFFLPLVLLALALPSCGNTPGNMEEVNKLKNLLSKQDLSPAYDKMFVSQFAQNYEAYASNNGLDEEAETHFYTYRGAGWFGCLYEVSEEAFAEANALESQDFFDYLARGKGDYGMMQTGNLVSYQYEADKDKDNISLKSMQFAQNLDARFTESDVQVYNCLYYKDSVEGGFDGDAYQLFNGIIDKETLFEGITVRAFSDIFARTNLFDGQRSCETLDRIYFATLKELSSKSDAELSDFITKNAIRIEEEGDNALVHFKVGDENLRATLEENDIFPGTFEGTLTYEKESGKFSAFDYQIAYAANESDASQGNVNTVSMEFKASGYSWNQKYDKELDINPNPTVYEDAEEFLDDVVEQVIPPSI